MTIELMRENLCTITENLKSAHAGLLMQRGLRQWEDGEKPIKKKLILDISSVRPDDLYLLAFNRWLNTTYDKTTFATLSATIDGRLFTGLLLGGTLEIGAMTHHSYGMPMIAGSSIKGAVRNYAEHLFAQRDDDNQIQYDKDGKVIIQSGKQYVLDILFGTDSDDDNADAGYLIWHDAWWIPQINNDGTLSYGATNQPFVSEIITVHHQQYYHGDLSEALDIENPVPNQQIAIQGSFYFVIEGDSKWADFAQTLLQDMLQEQGLGAKGSNGYGYFQLDNHALKPYLALVEQAKKAEQDKLNQQKAEQEKANLSENQSLVYDFKAELDKKPTNEWHNKPQVALDIVVHGEKLGFAELFKKVESWDDDDQQYALEHVFSPNQKHLSKKLQDKVKALKKKF